MSLTNQILNHPSQSAVFLVTANLEQSYRSVSNIYTIIHLANARIPAYILDVQGDSTELVYPPRSVKLDEITEASLELNNPQRHYYMICTSMPTNLLRRLRAQLGLAEQVSSNADQELLAQDLRSNGINVTPQKLTRYRYQGTGAVISFIYLCDNTYELGLNFKSMGDLASYDWRGVLVRGVANMQQFEWLARGTRLATTPKSIYYPVITGMNPLQPKKLKVCFVLTMIRFMAIENIRYFIKAQDPELYEQIEFVNVSEMEISRAKQEITDSMALVCLDMANEFPIMLAEAMESANVILGFSNTFDNYSNLPEHGADFSPEGSYQNIANKLLEYACIYRDELARDPHYLHPKARAAQLFSQNHFQSANFVNVVQEMMNTLGVTHD